MDTERSAAVRIEACMYNLLSSAISFCSLYKRVVVLLVEKEDGVDLSAPEHGKPLSLAYDEHAGLRDARLLQFVRDLEEINRAAWRMSQEGAPPTKWSETPSPGDTHSLPGSRETEHAWGAQLLCWRILELLERVRVYYVENLDLYPGANEWADFSEQCGNVRRGARCLMESLQTYVDKVDFRTLQRREFPREVYFAK